MIPDPSATNVPPRRARLAPVPPKPPEPTLGDVARWAVIAMGFGGFFGATVYCALHALGAA